MNFDYIFTDNLSDPVVRGILNNNCYLRSYQAEALRTIYGAVMAGKGGRFAVTFPRQSGKNETQAQLEAAVMSASLWRGGNIIKILPTEKNQGRISTERLANVLKVRSQIPGRTESDPRRGSDFGINEKQTLTGAELPLRIDQAKPALCGAGSFAVPSFGGNRPRLPFKTKKDEITYGSAKLRCLSASPNAAIVGATADLMLEVDEAQLVPADKFDREAAPMAASTNAVQVFWGTAWDDQTLLARETRLAHLDGDRDGRKHVFTTTCVEVGKEVPKYAEFVKGQIERLGREHPAVRTQFFCEEITELTSMFTADRIIKMKGGHDPLYGPEQDRCYVFLIDVAGSDELTPSSKKANGFSDRRDATVVTICDVYLPEDKAYDKKNFVWKVVARRLYRNTRTELLEKELCGEIDRWRPKKIIIDHSGMGAMLSDILIGKYKRKVYPIDITAPNKTKMAWDFLSMVDTGRWVEYKGNEMEVLQSGFTPGTDRYEMLKEPELLQQMFFRELRACRIEPTGNGMNVRWGVKDGTRDHATGRMIHDDLVMSAAMAVFESGNLPICNVLPDWEMPQMNDPLVDHFRRTARIY